MEDYDESKTCKNGRSDRNGAGAFRFRCASQCRIAGSVSPRRWLLQAQAEVLQTSPEMLQAATGLLQTQTRLLQTQAHLLRPEGL